MGTGLSSPVPKEKVMNCYQKELNEAYADYYRERWDRQKLDPSDNSFELELWEKWETRFFEIFRKYYK